MARLSGRRVGVFVEEGFEDLEFWVTVMRLREEGADVRIVGTHAGERYRGKNALSAASDIQRGPAAPGVLSVGSPSIRLGTTSPTGDREVEGCPETFRHDVSRHHIRARGRAPTESTRVEGGFELLVRVPWTKSRTQRRQR
jgi:hypothetical protein